MKRGWWIALVLLPLELGAVGYLAGHPVWRQTILRTVYEWGWQFLPLPPGVTDHPHRF